MPIPKLLPKQPDPYIVRPRDQELAKFGHLNWLIGQINASPPGGINSVGANAPLSSTGGSNPVINLNQAGVGSDGFLSAADFNYFAAKMDPLGYVPENVANKAVTFGTVNNTLYPTVEAVNNRILQFLAGLDWKEQARAATTANITLAGVQTIDGVLLAPGDRVLVKNQTAQSENGVYIVVDPGAWTRSTDTNTAALLEQMAITVTSGTVNGDSSYVQTTNPITLGSSNVVYSPFGTSVPIATPTVYGIVKLYTTTGSNLDGTMDQNSITNALALKLGSVPTTNATWVSSGGSDAGPTIGLLERFDRPFASILAARAAILAASPSELPHTIFVLPGDRVEIAPIELDTDINYEFLGTGTLTTSSGSWIFQCTDNSDVTINAPGWSFIGTGTKNFVDAGLYTGINLHMNIKENLLESGVNFDLNCDTSNLWIKADKISSTGDDSAGTFIGGTNLNGSNIYVDANEIYENGDNAIVFFVENGNFFVKVKSLSAPVGGAIKVGNSNAGCKMFFDIDRNVCGGLTWPVWVNGASVHMGYRGVELVGSSDCLVVNEFGAGTFYVSLERLHSTRVGTVDGLVHAGAPKIYLNNATITRVATATGGGDIKTSKVGVASPVLFLKDVSYDITRQNILLQGQAQYWNGTTYTNVLRVLNNPVASGNTVVDADTNNSIVNFANFTGCTFGPVTATGQTYTFTGNGQTISTPLRSTQKLVINVSQVGVAAPTVNATQLNTTGTTVSFAYVASGHYSMILSASRFTANNWSLNIGGNIVPYTSIMTQNVSGTTIDIFTLDVPGVSEVDGILGNTILDFTFYF